MKQIILVRHSEPQKSSGLPNEAIPLTGNGVLLAKKLFETPTFAGATSVHSSPYKRALDTAALLGLPITTDDRLAERKLGDESTLNGDFWARQYADPNFKNKDGESLRETGKRMTAFMGDLLQKMDDSETAVVVSHAAAICAYLMNFCTVTVLDAAQKVRKIVFQSETVLNGKIGTPSAFLLEFCEGVLTNISHIE